MASMTYKEQLLHPNWQRKRLEVLQRDNFTCQSCYDEDKTLHVHHKRYVKGRMAWEYPNGELVTLCWPCHELQHEEADAFRELVALLPIDGPSCVGNARGLLAGWANGEQGNDFSAHFTDEPFNYSLGEVANKLGWACPIDQLMSLVEALSSRNSETVRAAVSDFVKDLKTRATVTPRPFDPKKDL